jgi:hypothetical protein
MANGKNVDNNIWPEKLKWKEKVSICNQGINSEDSLLLTLVIMVLAFEAILFTILIGPGWGQYWSIAIAFFGIGIIILYMYLFEKRGEWVDKWGKILFSLYEDVNNKEISKNYLGCVERIDKRKEKCGWWKVMFGWCEKVDSEESFKRIKQFFSWFNCLKSTRRLFTTFIPLILVIIWVVVIVFSLVFR